MISKLVVLIVSVCILLVPKTVFAGSDDFLVEYPDGRYGVDLGGGYEVDPDGQTIMPQGYREPYQDTFYGPTSQKGLLLFPEFSFQESTRKAKAAKEKEDKMSDQMFIEGDSTTAANSVMWGVYIPGEDDEPEEAEPTESPE